MAFLGEGQEIAERAEGHELSAVATAEEKTARRKRTWRQDPEGRRTRILEAAASEFALKGFQETRLDVIAEKAAVSEGLVYAQFGTKRGLLEAVGNTYGQGLAEATFGDGQQYHPSDMETIVDNVFAYVREAGEGLSAFLLANDPTEGGLAHDANRTQMVAAIKNNLDRWRTQDLIPEMDTRVMAEVHFALVEGALSDCFLRGNGADEKAYRREVTRTLQASVTRMP